MLDGKTYWIVGASEGLGRALAEEMDAAGAKLILSARSQDRLEALAGALKHTARAVPCDVTSSDSVLAAWQSVGDIDGVIYMAGAYEPMRAQDWNGDDVARICEVNFTGATRILSHVVPSFTKRGAGHIVIVGSLAGYRGLPGAIGYGASKAAIMHLAETLEADLWHTPVRVQLFNPGFIRTRLTDKNQFSMP
ncbi:MAG: SDR family NAD(P)-dependent oxidoreductase, partial [Pseudomonadota bacterium]